MTPARVVAIVIGALLGLIAMGLIVGGAVLIWAHSTQRDSSGFFETADRRVASEGYALTSPDIDVNVDPEVGDWLPRGETAAVRLEVRSAGDEPVFIGIGPTDSVTDYLGEVAHDEITDFGYPARTIEYRSVEGGSPDSAPGEQDFWVAESEGQGSQSIEWSVDDGNWTAVIMNADASQGVDADLSLGGRFDLLLAIGIGLLVGGLVLGLVAAALVFLGLWRSRPAARPPLPSQPAPPPPPAAPPV